MATQGYNASVSFDSNAVGVADSVTFTLNAADLDITQFGDDAMRRLAGLFDAPTTLSGQFDNADAGLSSLQTNFASRTAATVQVLLDGTNGYSVSAFIQSLEFTAEVSGVVEFSATLMSTGSFSAVP